MPPFPTWRSHKALTGSLISGLFLLLTSLFGPFLLRTFERRRLTPATSNNLTTNTKPEGNSGSAATEKDPSNTQDGQSTEPPEPQRFPETLTELDMYYAFISQLPPPTLGFASSPHQPTLPEPDSKGTKRQRIYKDFSRAGQARTVLEQRQDFGNGGLWRRKLVVYSALGEKTGWTMPG